MEERGEEDERTGRDEVRGKEGREERRGERRGEERERG